ncbi:hypothetical protein KY329_04150 [Candidatus Woesearchaeota archaeon]|nr:hypothetical protein [Candidatus Woesearchaeota archaeon]
MGLFDKKNKAGLPLPPPPPRQPEVAPEIPELPPRPSAFEPIQAREEVLPIEAPVPILVREEEVEYIEPPRAPSKSFVAIEDFKSIINNSNVVRAKISEAEELVKHLSDIKSEEERLFERWRSSLDQIEKKLNYVDKVIEKAQR